ncbi:MAG: putative sulfate/molybdate transporter [Dehalococcoidales bacterium]|nr:putative sulfate/molybdate transporter [Dehalococcoidales bacterium]
MMYQETIDNFAQTANTRIRLATFRFNIQEFGGALADLGTLLPLMVALILVNGLNPTSVLMVTGLFYITSGLYYRLPMPVQPLKAVSAIAISMGLSATVIGAAGLIMGLILAFFSMTNLISRIVKFFPRTVVRGIQLSIGLMLFRKGLEFVFGGQTFISSATPSVDIASTGTGILLALLSLAVFLFSKIILFKKNQRFSPPLALLAFGVVSGVVLYPTSGLLQLNPVPPSLSLPNATDLWVALTVLVLPQLPLTLGNAVVGTQDTAQVYFGEKAAKATPRALTASMGIANIIAGLLSAMPMCHGSGGLTAHYRLGARTGGAAIMMGTILLIVGLFFGQGAASVFSLIPLSVLGVLLFIVGVYHAALVRDVRTSSGVAVIATVSIISLTTGNLAYGFGAGIIINHIINSSKSRIKGRSPEVKITA